mmetsp:Transcript_24137/g.67814  ORF Transcript_24137/g.67814 Transcript_24137/m.67814 type:complete len:81 (+) Transcript_24137:624-866(+)
MPRSSDGAQPSRMARHRASAQHPKGRIARAGVRRDCDRASAVSPPPFYRMGVWWALQLAAILLKTCVLKRRSCDLSEFVH